MLHENTRVDFFLHRSFKRRFRHESLSHFRPLWNLLSQNFNRQGRFFFFGFRFFFNLIASTVALQSASQNYYEFEGSANWTVSNHDTPALRWSAILVIRVPKLNRTTRTKQEEIFKPLLEGNDGHVSAKLALQRMLHILNHPSPFHGPRVNDIVRRC